MSLFDKFRNRRRKPGEKMPISEPKLSSVIQGASLESDVHHVSEYTQAWLDAVNTGARFRIDFASAIHDSDGMPYARVHPVDENTSASHTFRSVALCLAERGIGAVLCHSGWDSNSDDPNSLILPVGELVEFLLLGRLAPMPQNSEDWGMQEDHGLGTYSEPDTLLLPLQCRRIIHPAMRRIKQKTGLHLILSSPSLVPQNGRRDWRKLKRKKPCETIAGLFAIKNKI